MTTVGVDILATEVAAERDAAFSTFVASHRERARRLAWRLIGGDDAAAEDVTQDAFVKAYQRQQLVPSSQTRHRKTPELGRA